MKSFTGPAIRVRQPIGTFWVASIPADVLLECTVPDPLRVVLDPNQRDTAEWDRQMKLLGNQRHLHQARIESIAKYIDSIESTFPNSIILAAPSVDQVQRQESSASAATSPWLISGTEENVATLTIPERPICAHVVDGQHRLYGFLHTQIEQRRGFELLCSIFFDIPTPVQAMIFATINTTQKPVPRAMALNLFGYNVEDEDRDVWSPEKLCVFIARRLNFDQEGSRLFQRIKIEAEGAPQPKLLKNATRAVSLTAVVDGIRALISTDPRSDQTELRSERVFRRHRRSSLRLDASPLRRWYLDCADRELYELVRMYVEVLDETFWESAPPRSMLTRAVGIRALFGYLRARLSACEDIGSERSDQKIRSFIADIRVSLQKCGNVDFADSYFEATGRGQMRILNALLVASDSSPIETLGLAENDRNELRRLTASESK